MDTLFGKVSGWDVPLKGIHRRAVCGFLKEEKKAAEDAALQKKRAACIPKGKHAAAVHF